jgi:SAM-dependent methyltransferase
MKECSKSIIRRMQNPNFLRHYFNGDGIDIGGAPDPLYLYQELFPFIKSVLCWDINNGDAQFMKGVSDHSFDFVHSSHCLEHLTNPLEALNNWMRILKPGGYLIVTVPDEDMYEQGIFPSTFNGDHKHTFTIYKRKSWSTASINLLELILSIESDFDLKVIQVIDIAYRHKLPRFDQTLTPVAESAIEFVLKKRTKVESEIGGSYNSKFQLKSNFLIHLNQYCDDQKTLKDSNKLRSPFTNTKSI